MLYRSAPAWRLLFCGFSAVLLLATAGAAQAQDEQATADVVVIVDTSASMRQPGMDRERTSLLVTKLLADLVPGELAAVRLLDIIADQDVLQQKDTGDVEPCREDPSKECKVIEPTSDWEADARRDRLGAIERPARGDRQFKVQLETHLAQRINNSPFRLAFRAAQGVFDQRPPADDGVVVPRTIIWLSDGKADHPDRVRQVIAELAGDDIAIEAIVFGKGDPQLARDADLDPHQISTPAEIMKAFAGAFRRIVQAPYEIDNLVAQSPSFEMKPNVDEAWVVVYGDDSLGDVAIEGPDRDVRATYAADRWPEAGAYRVAHMEDPTPGQWKVAVSGGGPGVAYAVVQRSALTPSLLEPDQTTAGVSVALVAGVRAGLDGELIADRELLADAVLTATFEGQSLDLVDDGTQGDAVAGDGRYTALGRFRGTGLIPVKLDLVSTLVERSRQEQVEVLGGFRYSGDAIEIDLGTLGVDSESCRPLDLSAAEHQGEIAFELERLRKPPGGHRLEVRLPAGTLTPGSDPLVAMTGDPFELCLTTSPRVRSSQAEGEPWLRLRVAGSEAPELGVTLALRWQVEGLSFWARWGKLILLILLILLLIFIIAGFIVPERFPGSFALTFVPDQDELDEQTPQPIKQWKGVGIGFYRNARAFLHADYRLSGSSQGALAALHAERGGARVAPGKGMTLYRETLDLDWEHVSLEGRRGRAGDVFRIGDNGPYFRLSTRGRR